MENRDAIRELVKLWKHSNEITELQEQKKEIIQIDVELDQNWMAAQQPAIFQEAMV